MDAVTGHGGRSYRVNENCGLVMCCHRPAEGAHIKRIK
jgi:hypothetical protein